ncbi:MAG: hypothetical protein JWQ44_12 [Chthoniobacter sp.]|nr:hypothetical protein [Chthoniobacter sp.]
MKACALLAVMGLLAGSVTVAAVDPRERSDRGQFTVYCEDGPLRRQIVSFASQTKADLLQFLGESDGNGRRPIVITLEPASGVAGETPLNFRVVHSDVGLKVEIAVRYSENPDGVNLQKHLVRALLLEYMYRRSGVEGGERYAEPPWWLVEGVIQTWRRRDSGVESGLFERLIETNKLPPIERFLVQKPDELGPTALAVDQALALCLVQLLVDQPGGRDKLTALLRGWPDYGNDAVAALVKHFPAFAGGAPALQKWWTLNLARFAALNRYQSLTAEQTDQELGALLQFDLTDPKTGQVRHFTMRDFAAFAKLPGAGAAVAGRHAALVALSTRSNALLRPVLQEYEQILAALARGKTRGLRERIDKADHVRGMLVRRVAEIADYLNWFEVTQSGHSNAFDNYLKTANEISEQDKRRKDPIARYLDQLEQEY